MKRITILSIATISIIVLISSCRNRMISTLSTPMYSPAARINEIRAKVNVDINKKISGESSAAYFLFLKLNGDSNYASGVSYSSESTIDNQKYLKLKSAAAYKAINESGADIIVHPNYVVSIDDFKSN